MIKRKLFFLKNTIDLEEKLAQQALSGQTLAKIQNRKFHYNAKLTDSAFFLLDPEKGNDSEVWLYHDFQKLGAEPVPVLGFTFFMPSYVLRLDSKQLEDKNSLAFYYYRYRNYRILRRLRTNTISSAVFTALSAVLLVLSSGIGCIFDLILLIGSSTVLMHFVTSLFHFRKSCKRVYNTADFQKPKRPGY